MAVFRIFGENPTTKEQKDFYYDTSDSRLADSQGNHIITNRTVQAPKEQVKLESGKGDLTAVKIQLGLSCNFECDYCSQRFVPRADETNVNDIQAFVDNMDNWFDGGENGKGLGVKFEYWGGEPFVYWKTMKPLVEALNAKYPNVTNLVITNGSLLDDEKIEWMNKYDFRIAISHDGPGQHVRGPDPLDDCGSKQAILNTYKIFAPKGKFSFNAMMNLHNTSRKNINAYFEELIKNSLGDEYLQYLVIGEGTFVDAYDEGGLNNSLVDEEKAMMYRHESHLDIRNNTTSRFNAINRKVEYFISTIQNGNRLDSLHQKCGMDRRNNIAVDLNGNVLTCQNVSAVSNNPAGIAHKLGHVNNLEAITVATGTHWSDRAECPNCPVIHLCQGACMFLTGDLWEASCDNSFNDNIAIFANVFELLTGYIPVHIEGPQREDRKDIFWWINGRPEQLRKAKKVIPIKAA